MKNNKILLFIPIYNCEKQISRVLAQIDKEVVPYIEEVIIVNNLSTDKSEEVIVEYLKSNAVACKVSLLRNKENYSLGGSHKVAFDYAMKNSFDYVIVLHGDDQGDIHDALPYIKNAAIEKYDSLLGSRFEKDSILKNYSRFRIFGNHVMNKFISLLAKHRMTDLGSGLNIYKTEYLQSKFYLTFPNNLTFNVYMLLYGLYVRSKFDFFPLTWKEEDQVSNAKLISQTREIVGLVLKYFTNSKKLFSTQENKFSRIKYESDLIYSNR